MAGLDPTVPQAAAVGARGVGRSITSLLGWSTVSPSPSPSPSPHARGAAMLKVGQWAEVRSNRRRPQHPPRGGGGSLWGSTASAPSLPHPPPSPLP